MKRYSSLAVSGAMLVLLGCSTPQKVAVLAPVGSAPTALQTQTADGSLRVYSARLRADLSVSQEAFFWNADDGKNEFLFAPRHSAYSIYDEKGVLLRKVENARNTQDPDPALVPLPAGNYEIAAEAENGYGGTEPVQVPVVIRPGETTEVHLVQGWRPHGHYSQTEIVPSPSGDVAGWRAGS